ncbi:MAG: hypothetical protein A2499_05465 [Stygiobacter sp. RIFOXYC12_FULL_38_8]|nr:MAG: hypothetical protein A2X62_05150 [Stygiobacter sp. GWC2_38_9]OGU83987.1 MAG: hypothetical protein A2279_12240 [Stygiobacter sp. RIFOXYA12_FULL_38_9]OGV07428.1 MAG: hypothetical protein A2299_17620 [Stygiobacter sp. RIFOXYB2_FULL_37_11]OGV12262.1 MAG: hypothetical protein A2237_16295 [Stygiobacter sp. RIFOXYA2_FULL_38_8]OGV13686.1 MAG: hypothetical protein A2440_11015 [Stygiobacter sp. RIFOXYC2_FULL_38_25]OGV25400.1 MAG: hypothetical protein A2499_05465 [Stygiobacter sp. RIFOXYC12_FULL_
MKKSILFLSLSILVLTFSESYSQVDTLKSPTMKVILSDSTVYWGRITSSDAERIILSTKSGTEISIPKKQISEIYRAQDLPKEKKRTILLSKEEDISDDVVYVDRNAFKLFISPTAKPVKENEGFVSLNEILFPLAGFGIKNIVSVAGGIPLLPFEENPIYYLSAKVTFINNNILSVAAGYITANTSFSGSKPDLNLVHITATFGDDFNNFTSSINVDISSKSGDGNDVIIFGGQKQLSNQGKIIGEFWIPLNSHSFLRNSILMLGFRAYSKSFSGDACLGRIFSEHGAFIPWVSLSYNFNLYK